MTAAGFRLRRIKDQALLGQKLCKARKKLKISIEEAEAKTKVRTKYLEALENGDYRLLPSNVYIKGFLQNYCQLLNLDFEEIFNLYQKERRSFCCEPDLLPKSISVNGDQPLIVISPRTFIWPTIGVLVISVVGYIIFQVSGFAAAPKLEIISPAKDMVITRTDQLFEGQTDIGSELSINGQEVVVSEDGRFSEIVKLQRGLNTVELTAKNKNKKETKKTCIIEVREQTALK
jgi:transcriptional regulator with XRE-family HTH domain